MAEHKHLSASDLYSMTELLKDKGYLILNTGDDLVALSQCVEIGVGFGGREPDGGNAKPSESAAARAARTPGACSSPPSSSPIKTASGLLRFSTTTGPLRA